jgi:hypothetical protein
MKKPTSKEIEQALLDVLDGNAKWCDIQGNTGLQMERCKEIEKIYWDLLEYNKTH